MQKTIVYLFLTLLLIIFTVGCSKHGPDHPEDNWVFVEDGAHMNCYIAEVDYQQMCGGKMFVKNSQTTATFQFVNYFNPDSYKKPTDLSACNPDKAGLMRYMIKEDDGSEWNKNNVKYMDGCYEDSDKGHSYSPFAGSALITLPGSFDSNYELSILMRCCLLFDINTSMTWKYTERRYVLKYDPSATLCGTGWDDQGCKEVIPPAVPCSDTPGPNINGTQTAIANIYATETAVTISNAKNSKHQTL